MGFDVGERIRRKTLYLWYRIYSQTLQLADTELICGLYLHDRHTGAELFSVY